MKCDRAEPACGWCARNNRECVYKERKKPGIRVGYGRELEDKIKRLEAMLQVLGRRVEDHILDHDSSDSVHVLKAAKLDFQSPSSAFDSRLARSTTIDNRNADTPLSGPAWSRGLVDERLQFSKQPDTMSIQSVVASPALEQTPSLPPQLSRTKSATPSTIPGATPIVSESELPPHDLLYAIVDTYFKHVNPWIPILDRKDTFDRLFGAATLDEADRILLHAIVATTLRFTKDQRLTTQSRKHYHDVSKQKVQLYALENPDLRALQALVILAVDISGTSNGPEGWNIYAVIVRNIVQMGLCVEKSAFLERPTYPSLATLQEFILPQPKSWIEDEGRRRLFWVVYGLDRYATVATSSDFMLDDKEMDRQLPCRYDLFSKDEPVDTKWFRWPERPETILNRPENLGSFSYHCEILRTLSRIHKFLRKPVDISSHSEVQQWRETYRELDAELNDWLQHLPGEYGKISQLCHSDPGSRVSNWIMIHAAFVTSVIRLHSAAAYPTVRSHIFTPSYNAVQRCLAAVESLRDIAEDVMNTNMLDLLGPPFAFSLWVSARLLIVHAATMECEVDPKMGFFISTLEQMGQFWNVARTYAAILSRVMQEYGQKEQSYEGGPQIAKTFTTMRRYVKPPLVLPLCLILSDVPMI